MESGGNQNYPYVNSSAALSTLHWGPNFFLNKYQLTTNRATAPQGHSLSDDFHTYGMEWTEEGIRTYIDGDTILQVDFDKTSWNRGQFPESSMNPWEGGDISAPFDQEFYLVCTKNQ